MILLSNCIKHSRTTNTFTSYIDFIIIFKSFNDFKVISYLIVAGGSPWRWTVDSVEKETLLWQQHCQVLHCLRYWSVPLPSQPTNSLSRSQARELAVGRCWLRQTGRFWIRQKVEEWRNDENLLRHARVRTTRVDSEERTRYQRRLLVARNSHFWNARGQATLFRSWQHEVIQ